MEGKSFERELPQGYRLASVMDAAKGKFAVIFTLISLVFLIVAVGALTLPFILDPKPIDDFLYGYGYFMIGLLSSFVYIVLHELVHGAAYKKLTGEKLTYGFTFTCAYCGVPRIFTYRKTALIAVLAPFVLFTVLLIPALAVAYNVSVGLYIVLAVVFAMHFQGCSGDLYVTCLLLFKYRDGRTLMNDTGPRMALFVPDETLLGKEDEKTAGFIADMKAEQAKIRNNSTRYATKKRER